MEYPNPCFDKHQLVRQVAIRSIVCTASETVVYLVEKIEGSNKYCNKVIMYTSTRLPESVVIRWYQALRDKSQKSGRKGKST